MSRIGSAVFVVVICLLYSGEIEAQLQINACIQPLNQGSGQLIELNPRWYWDPVRDNCYEFAYTGQGGNNNRYPNYQSCINACGGGGVRGPCEQPRKPGFCLAIFPRWYYNTTNNQCMPFNYGGCGANDNNFPNEQSCEARCEVRTTTVPSPTGPCTALPDPGPCDANILQWYWNDFGARCETFFYGGCGGNSNRYSTLEECEARCRIDRRGDRCDQPKQSGICLAYFPRWYYDQDDNDCKPFIYGGCGGNENNFQTEDECEDECEEDDLSMTVIIIICIVVPLGVIIIIVIVVWVCCCCGCCGGCGCYCCCPGDEWDGHGGPGPIHGGPGGVRVAQVY